MENPPFWGAYVDTEQGDCLAFMPDRELYGFSSNMATLHSLPRGQRDSLPPVNMEPDRGSQRWSSRTPCQVP